MIIYSNFENYYCYFIVPIIVQYVCIVFSNGHVLWNLSGVCCVNIMIAIVISFYCIITYYVTLCKRYWVLYGID